MSIAQSDDPRIDPGGQRDAQAGELGNAIRPNVALPPGGVPVPLAIALGLMLAVALFIFLDTHRRASNAPGNGASNSAPVNLPPPPPALALPPPPAPLVTQVPAPAPAKSIGPVRQASPVRIPASVPPPFVVNKPVEPAESAQPEPHRQTHDGANNALVVDLTNGDGADVNGGNGNGNARTRESLSSRQNSSASSASNDEPANATLIHNQAALVSEGSVISAVLETPLDSTAPGLARAVVAADVRGFDGSRVLIPRGSRLIGQFKADESPSQRRILVTWDRLIRPDGVAIKISSPATDAKGTSGISGSVNTHFWSRFGSAVLQSVLAAGTSIASSLPAGGSGSSAVYVGAANSTSQIGAQLVPVQNLPPRIKVKEGARIAVLVARDLNFAGTPAVR